MKLSRRTKYVLAAPLFVVASLALQLTHTIPTYAATLTWTGDGDGTSFSDGDNWNTDAAPVNNDVLTFSLAGLTAQQTLDNDIDNLSVAGIVFTGAINEYNNYTIQGNDLTITGDIVNTASGANADFSIPTIQNNLTLGANAAISKVNIGLVGATLNLQSHDLTFSSVANTCGVSLLSNLSGNGAFAVTGAGVNVRGNSPSYTGLISVTGDASFAPTSFGAPSAGTTVSGAGSLNIVNTANITVSEPFTLGGTGNFGSVQGFYACSGGDGPASTLTLDGGVTLTSNFLYRGSNNTTIVAPYTSNDHAFTVAGGVTGTLTTPQGEVIAPEETITLDGDSTDFVSIGHKQTGILNGTRDYISVGDGGVLKGTGSANTVFIQEGAVIAPGNSPGSITILDQFGLGGAYQAEILNKDTYDRIIAGEENGGSNAVDILSTASLNVVLYDGWSVAQGDSFTIIDNRSSIPVSGTFDGLAEGAQFVVDGITFSITYAGGDGNDVVITALNAGNDPDAPNTGVAQFVQANPAVVAGFGILAAGLLIAVAIRRRNTQ